MTDRPILFSAPMIRALLVGTKTQTRRVLKPQPYEFDGRWWIVDRHSGDCHLDLWSRGDVGCMPYFVGDRMWVREAHRFRGADYGDNGGEIEWFRVYGNGVVSASWDPTFPDGFEPTPHDRVREMTGPDDQEDMGVTGYVTKVRSPIHMPRWASRLTLTVTAVRVQRLQDISEADAMAEGATERAASYGFKKASPGWSMDWTRADRGELPASDISLGGPRWAFANMWNTLHGPDAWDANPWVVAITFDVRKGNIDA